MKGGSAHWVQVSRREACSNRAVVTGLQLMCTLVSERQVLTSSPFPVVPPGTQGPQLLLGLVPSSGGRGGQRGLG